MMLSEVSQSGNCDDSEGNSSSGRLLRDIEEISKALYLNRTPQKALISSSSQRSKSVEKPRLSASRSILNPRIFDECRSYKDKKSPAIWNWKKPLKALARIRHPKFNVCFFLHVKTIEGLPPNFNDISLSVHWKRKDEILQTNLSSVSNGIAEFNETLMHKCCVYGSRSGPNHSAKYEPKLFQIYVSLMGVGVDLGKHCIDLTRLLPLTLDDLEGEKSTGKWTTSFKLAGKAKGATLNVSFGFLVMKGNLNELRRNMYAPEVDSLAHGRLHAVDPTTGFEKHNRNRMLRRVESVPSNLHPHSLHSVGVNISGDVSQHLGLELSKSINCLYEKLNETGFHGSEELYVSSGDGQPLESELGIELKGDKDISDEDEMIEFTVIEQGIEIPKREHIDCEQGAHQAGEGSVIEFTNMGETVETDVALGDKTRFYSADKTSDSHGDEVFIDDLKNEDKGTYEEGSGMEDLDLALNVLVPESTMFGPSLAINEFPEQENYMESKASYKSSEVVKESSCLDEITEAVANDFLNMLGIDHSPLATSSNSDPESPRERLLREFEKDPLASGNFIAEYDEIRGGEGYGCIAPAGSSSSGIYEGFDLSLVIQAAEEDHQRESQLLSRRKKAKDLEDLETGALMKEWGLNEMAFQNSPRHCTDGFGSPLELLPEEPVELPPLGDGFGPLIQTKGGGCLMTMNPALFRNSKNVGSLIMQVSCPIVLPAEMSSDIMEIFQHLASIGIDKLSTLTNKLMPLEDITGRTLQKISVDAKHLESRTGVEGICSGWFCNSMKSTLVGVQMDTEHVKLEDLAPLAIKKIENMLIEGLRVQSGFSQQGAPKVIKSHPFGTKSSFKEKCADLIALLSFEGAATQEVKDTDSGSDGLLGLSITLEEWLRLDAGIIGDESQVSEGTIMKLAAHHAKSLEIINGRLATDSNCDEISDIKHGFLGNNLTLAFTVLLRDPLRNYEPVGTSMLALIQLEKTIFNPRSNLDGTLLERSKAEKHEGSLGFKITEAHLSGLNTEPGKIQPWGSKTQQQSGTRWLLASGLSKPCNNPLSKSKAIVVSNPRLARKMQTDEMLWSISCQANGTQTSKQEMAAFTQHIRNPDILFPKSFLVGLGLTYRRCPDPENCGALNPPKRVYTMLYDETNPKKSSEEDTDKPELLLVKWRQRFYEPDEIVKKLGKRVVLEELEPVEGADKSWVYRVREEKTKERPPGRTRIEVYPVPPNQPEENDEE